MTSSRPHPDDVLAPFVRRQRDRPLFDAQRLQPLEQIVRHLLGVAGADPAGVAQLAVLVYRRDKRADRRSAWPSPARSRRRSNSWPPRHLLLMKLSERPERYGALRRLEMMPSRPISQAVSRMSAAALVEVIGVADQPLFVRRPSSSRASAALRSINGSPRKIPAVERQEIEDIVDEAIVAPVLQVRLQQREAADAALVLHDDFAVEQRALGRKRGNRRRDRSETGASSPARGASEAAPCRDQAALPCGSRRT